MTQRSTRGSPILRAVWLTPERPTTAIETLLLDMLEPNLSNQRLRAAMLEELARPVKLTDVILEYLGLRPVGLDSEGELPLLLVSPKPGRDPWRQILLLPGGDCPIGLLVKTRDRGQLALVHEVVDHFSPVEKDIVRRYAALAARDRGHERIVKTLSAGRDPSRPYAKMVSGARRQVETFLDPSVLLSPDEEIRVQLGSLSETTKNLLREGIRGEYVFILPRLLFEGRTNYADMEFLVYLNFFVRWGQRTRIVGTERQRWTLERLLTLVIFGLFDPREMEPPTLASLEERYGVPDLATLTLLRTAYEAYAVRAPDASNRILSIDEYVDFTVLEGDETVIPIDQDDGSGRRRLLGEVRVAPSVHGGFDVRIILANGQVATKQMGVTSRRRPGAVVPEHLAEAIRFATQRPRFGVTPLGTSHGFDPGGDVTSFVVWINGQGIFVDPSPEAVMYLEQIGVAVGDVPFVFLTHVHSDHDGGLIEKLLSGSRTTVIASDVVFRALVEKVELVTEHNFERERLVKHISANPGRPVPIEIGGEVATLETRWNLHPIPTNGFKIAVGGRTFGYSGDTQYDPDFIGEFLKQGKLTPSQADDLLYFFWSPEGTPRVDLLYHEAGIPPIHTQKEKLLAVPHALKARTFLVHIADKDVAEGFVPAKPPLFSTQVLLAPSAHASARSLIDTLRLVSYLYDVPSETLAELLRGAQIAEYRRDDQILTKGPVAKDDPLNFYVLVDGEVAVKDGRRVLAILTKGDSFGEWGISHQRGFRVTDVVAARPCQCLALSEKQYRWLVGRHPIIQERIGRIRALLPRLELAQARARLQAETDPSVRLSVIAHMTTNQLSSFALFSTVSTFKEGQPVVVEGADTDGFYVLLSGHLTATVGGHPVGELSEGDVFGEMGLLAGARRGATVTVTSADAEVLFMSTQNFLKLLESVPAFVLGVRETATRRQALSRTPRIGLTFG